MNQKNITLKEFNTRTLLKKLHQLTDILGEENTLLPIVEVYLHSGEVVRGIILTITTNPTYDESIIVKEYGFPGHTSEEQNLSFIAINAISIIKIKEKDLRTLIENANDDEFIIDLSPLTKLDLKRMIAEAETILSTNLGKKITIQINWDSIADIKNAHNYIAHLLKDLSSIFDSLLKNNDIEKEIKNKIQTISLHFNSSTKDKLENGSLHLSVNLPIQNKGYQNKLIESIKQLI